MRILVSLVVTCALFGSDNYKINGVITVPVVADAGNPSSGWANLQVNASGEWTCKLSDGTSCLVTGVDGPTTYTSATTWTRTGANHGLGTCALVVLLEMEIGATWQQVYAPAPCNSSTYDVVAAFGTATAGRMTLFKLGGGGGGSVSYSAGTGIDITSGVISVDSATVPTRLTATKSIDPASINNGACAYDSITLSGAADGDEVIVGTPSTADDGIVGFAKVSAANTVRLSICNMSGSAKDLGNLTWRVSIVRGF